MLPNNKTSVLKRLMDEGLSFDYILDVGILHSTEELRLLFPDTKQYLFEPIPEFHAHIEKIYRANSYELIKKACGREDGMSRLFQYSIKPEYEVTHSRIPNSAEEQPKPNEVETQVEVITLDSFTSGRRLAGTGLLKIDVDGNELEVLAGAHETLTKCSCVIIEAKKKEFFDRLSAMNALGFALYELCDFCYYDNVFMQCDLVMLNRSLVNINDFNPTWRNGGFKMDKWLKI